MHHSQRLPHARLLQTYLKKHWNSTDPLNRHSSAYPADESRLTIKLFTMNCTSAESEHSRRFAPVTNVDETQRLPTLSIRPPSES